MAKAVKIKKAVNGSAGKAEKQESSGGTRGLENSFMSEEELDRKQNAKGLERKKAAIKKKKSPTRGFAERGAAVNEVPPTEPDDENEAQEE